MPLYEYECGACGERFELIRKFSDPPLEVCAKCGKGPVIRLQSSPAFQFKGSGWYATDYAQKGKPDRAGKAEPSGADKPTGGTAESAASSEKSSTPAAEGTGKTEAAKPATPPKP